jgi:hypothetical protein
MPVLDSCHHQVVNALKKAEWTVAPNPFKLQTMTCTVYVDISAQKASNGAYRSSLVLLAEVKCFTERTNLELFIAFGQYQLYRAILAERADFRPIYLAVPSDAYNEVFDNPALRVVRESQIKLILVDLI